MKKRWAVGVGLAVGAAVALASHLAYWYGARERPGVPSPEALARLAAKDADVALWIPFPHQNLGRLERQVGDLRRWLELVSPARSLSAERLPTFGPWVLPPSRELVVVTRGEAIEVELAVYPTVGWLARLSGRLAGNPWLAGGEVALGRERRGEVEWRGGRWSLHGGPVGASVAPEDPRSPRPAPALATLRLREPWGFVPSGDYRLTRDPSGLVLAAGAPPLRLLPPLERSEPAPAGWIVERSGKRNLSATVIWPDEGPVPPFPAAMSLDRGGARRRRIPGEEMLRLAGGEPRREDVAGFTARALSAEELARGRPVAAELRERLDTNRALETWVGARPAALAEAAHQLAQRFAGLPLGHILGHRPEQIEALLAPLRDCPVTQLEVWSRPWAVRWQICLDPAAAAAPSLEPAAAPVAKTPTKGAAEKRKRRRPR